MRAAVLKRVVVSSECWKHWEIVNYIKNFKCHKGRLQSGRCQKNYYSAKRLLSYFSKFLSATMSCYNAAVVRSCYCSMDLLYILQSSQIIQGAAVRRLRSKIIDVLSTL